MALPAVNRRPQAEAVSQRIHVVIRGGWRQWKKRCQHSPILRCNLARTATASELSTP